MTDTRRNGFTLIEMLIAMTLLGIMVVLLFSSLRIAAESWEAGESKMAAVNQKAVVYQFFKRHLTSIRPVSVLDYDDNAEPGAGQPVFEGLAHDLQFVAALPASSARKGLQQFNINLDPVQPDRLVVRLTPYRQTESAQITDQTVDPPVVLLENIATLKFSYFGNGGADGEPGWQEVWANSEELPRLIKISIALNDGSYWPEMVVAPRITGNPPIDAVVGDQQEQEVANVETP